MALVLEAGVIGLLAFAPLAFGAVEVWSVSILEGSAFLLLATGLAAGLIKRSTIIEQIPWKLLGPFALFAALVLAQWIFSLTRYPHATRSAFLLMLAYGAVLFLLVTLLRSDERMERLIVALTVIGFIIALFGILQKYSWNGRLYWLRPPTQGGSPFGPFVNHNHFAGLMELIVPVGLGYAIDRFNAIPGRGKTVWRRFISRMSLPASSKILLLFFMLIVILSAVFLTLSRAGIVGMLSAFLLMAALFLVRSRTKRWVRHLGLTILIGFLFLTWFGLGPILERMATLKDLSGALEDRVQVWRDSLGIIRDSPVWGTGLGTFEAVFPAYRTATDDLAYAHAHNDYIQLAAETGLLGIVIVLGGTVIIFIKAIRALRIRRPQTPWRRGILIGGIGAIGAIAVHSAMDFNLHIPANALVLTAVIALIWNLSDAPLPSYPTSHVSPFPSHRSRFTSILIAVSVLSVVYLGYMAARQFITDRSYQRGRAHEASGNLEDALAAYRIAADRDGLNADYPLALARVHEKISEQTSIPPDERETHLNHALALLDRAATLGPTLPEPRLHRGWTHAALGHPEKAEADFAELIRLDPTNPNVQYYVGLWYAATGRADAAREMARKLRSAGRESKAEEIEQMVSRT